MYKMGDWNLYQYTEYEQKEKRNESVISNIQPSETEIKHSLNEEWGMKSKMSFIQLENNREEQVPPEILDLDLF